MALELAVSSLAARVLGQTHSLSLNTGMTTSTKSWGGLQPDLAPLKFCLCAALTDLFKALQGPDKTARAQEVLAQSSACHELLSLWDSEQKV